MEWIKSLGFVPRLILQLECSHYCIFMTFLGNYSKNSMISDNQATLPELNSVAGFLTDLPSLQMILKDYCFCDFPSTTRTLLHQQSEIPNQYIHPGLDSKVRLDF
ncbi:unnamed protein product [Moneuplotes crassus]|uniref:Uncharacterized protein n=1 Tax=Euplotes crassus TaxID=5936 RepID=A0AAD1X7I1_EUPCR|nr:unnamed protein product [Moneuplotes crassus]